MVPLADLASGFMAVAGGTTFDPSTGPTYVVGREVNPAACCSLVVVVAEVSFKQLVDPVVELIDQCLDIRPLEL